MNKWINQVIFLALIGLTACQQEAETGHPMSGKSVAQHTHFQLLDSTTTGVGFVNEVKDQPDFNILSYRNYYNGGGVALGDVNNDGLTDVYFTSNLKENKLYINKGDFRFEDVTNQAGVAGTQAWSTGVTMADVNGDGWLDIYVSCSGDVSGGMKVNELFINQGDLTFIEMAAEYGLDNAGYSTQAAFFDYDLDGDLDCYLLNNSFKDPSRIELFRSMRDEPDEEGGDKLYRNDGERFTDITLEAGIYSSEIGFGLGASIGDLNQDGYPDIYVSNDFWERDYLYLNRGDGTFSEELNDRIDFCSISSMGGDIGDINNDGYPEVISTDMLAADNYRLKAMSAFDPYHLEDIKYRANYHYQIGQNCLHLNDGNANFQEVGMLTGVAATDWSWGALLFDFSNRGRKDLFVSNGIQKDLMYMDFRDFLANNGIYQKIEQNVSLDIDDLVEKMPSNPIRNFAFVNEGNLAFVDETESLGLAQPSFSNGSAYGDLDNDGDMDLVINNVNMPAFIYKNEAESLANHYLKIRFEGPANNRFGIGCKVKIVTNDGLQTMQNFNTRGFQSSVEPLVHFGLGQTSSIEKVEVSWPDRKSQTFDHVEVDQILTVRYENATRSTSMEKEAVISMYSDITAQIIPDDAVHKENQYNDFDHEILLHRMLSTEGPELITGDINGDDLTDFVLLGAHGDEDKVYISGTDGKYSRFPQGELSSASAFESTCGALFDHDGDGDLDLLIGSGGNEYQRGGEVFALRYYENDGKGNFKLATDQVPPVVGNFSCIKTCDFDDDGDQDLFLGARTVPGNYGLPPRSFLLENDNGQWTDATPEALAGMGMITDATWTDLDDDSDQDLIVVGDWMPVQIFKNNNGVINYLTPVKDTKGWWSAIHAVDLDLDGDDDYVVGNWGHNSKFSASVSRPLTMYVNDFDQNGKTEFVINWYAPLDDQAYPFATKMELTKQLPVLRKQALKYEEYAHQTYETFFPQEVRQNSLLLETETLATGVLWNDSGHLTLKPLPVEAQISPVFAIAAGRLNGDTYPDIWLGGNFYALKPQVGRMSASRGVFLKGNGDGTFTYVTPTESGIQIRGEVRDAVFMEEAGKDILLVARNNDQIQAFEFERELN